MSEQLSPEPLGHVLSRICRLTYAQMHALVGPLGLHRGQPLVLKALWGQEGLTHTELGSLLHVRPATMTNMIKHMEQAGFVERRTDEQDRRISRVYLTAAGREVQGQVQQMWVDFEAQVFDGLDQQERELLRRMLEQVQDNLLHLQWIDI
jgi:DNA-binding MarR family transcriptional regulator